MNQKNLLTPEQVAEELQINVHTVWDWLREGKLKGKKMGRLWRVPRENLDEFLSPDEMGLRWGQPLELKILIDTDTVSIQSDEFGEMVSHLPDDIIKSLIKFFQKKASVEEPKWEDNRDFAAKVAYYMKAALQVRNAIVEDEWPYLICEHFSEVARIAEHSDWPSNSGLCPICRREDCNWSIEDKIDIESSQELDLENAPTIRINNHSHHDNLGVLVEGEFIEKAQREREAWLKKNPDEWLEG